MPRKPARHRQPYDDSEIALLYVFAPSPRARRLLARLLRRSEHAVDLVWRWMDGANFPREARNRIYLQARRIRRQLGPDNRGRIRL